MNKLKYTILICMFFMCGFFVSCSKGVGNNLNDFKARNYSHQISEIADVSFTLDSTTSPLITGVEYIEKEKLVIILYRNRLLFYDLDNRLLQGKIKIPSSSPTFFCYVSPDSIFTNSYTDKTLILFDRKGNIKSTYDVDFPSHLMSFPVAKTSSVLFKEDKLYFTGNISGEYTTENNKNRNVVMYYDFLNNKLNSTMSYSEIYQKYNWGGGLFRWVYSAYNDSCVIVSLPADHNVYVTDLKLEKTIKYASGSKYVESTDYIKQSKLMRVDGELKEKHFVESDSYANIFYDKYRNCYYRFVEKKIPYGGQNSWKKGLVVVALDNKFDVIGETEIEIYNEIFRYGSFVTEDGLHIPYSTNEDQLSFKVYQLCAIK